jgi:hypothetical protein
VELKGLFKELQVIKVPGSNNTNIAAQAGEFTLLQQEGRQSHVFTGAVSLDEYMISQPECPLRKVTLPIDQAGEVIRICGKYHITGAHLFPDYYGAAKAAMDDLYFWSKGKRPA